MKSISKRQLRIVIETETTTVIRNRPIDVHAVIPPPSHCGVVEELIAGSLRRRVAITEQLLEGDTSRDPADLS